MRTARLDGFGTGVGQSRDAHFGNAGDRLREWMFTTRLWQPGGSGGIDDEALAAAREAADGRDVRIGGGPTVVRDLLAAGPSTTCSPRWSRPCSATACASGWGSRGLETGYRVEAASSPGGVTHVTFTRTST